MPKSICQGVGELKQNVRKKDHGTNSPKEETAVPKSPKEEAQDQEIKNLGKGLLNMP